MQRYNKFMYEIILAGESFIYLAFFLCFVTLWTLLS